MQSNKQHTDFIRRLKQQPRQGATGPNIDEFFSGVKKVVDVFNKFDFTTIRS